MTAEFHSVASTLETARSVMPEVQATVVTTAEVIAILRDCGKSLGLSAQVLRSLELLLSFLPPKRNHHIVFASNDTLVHRAQGLHERSLRRHIAALSEAGLLKRSDSPNRKRYTCHDPRAGMTMRFGLDLSPLFARLPALREQAQEARAAAQQIAYLRRKLRAAASQLLNSEPDNAAAAEALKLSRRQLTASQLNDIAASLPQLAETESLPQQELLSGSDGQNDRHLLNLSKENIDKKEDDVLAEIAAKEPEALSYALSPIRSVADIEEHAEVLAPMLGISRKLFQEAIATIGRWKTSSVVWMIVENAKRITKPAAYFRAAALGKKAGSYRAWEWLGRIAQNCPRTI